MKRLISILILCAMLAGCSATEEILYEPAVEETTTTTVTAETETSEETTTTAAKTTHGETTVITEATTTITAATTTTAAATATTTVTNKAPAWTEQSASGTMYVNTNGIYSRKEAVMGSAKVKQYSLNDKVTVVAVTNTGYYKLADGSFIHKDYLSSSKTVITTTTPITTTTTATTLFGAPDDTDWWLNYYYGGAHVYNVDWGTRPLEFDDISNGEPIFRDGKKIYMHYDRYGNIWLDESDGNTSAAGKNIYQRDGYNYVYYYHLGLWSYRGGMFEAWFENGEVVIYTLWDYGDGKFHSIEGCTTVFMPDGTWQNDVDPEKIYLPTDMPFIYFAKNDDGTLYIHQIVGEEGIYIGK